MKLKQFVSGNEALALGAVNGGMKFYVAYPMTPVTSILHYLAVQAKKFKIAVHHAEDEISAANMAIVAAYAGMPAMTATSGGGFCLMTEALGLSAMSEVPLVIILGMRPGPSTGMPTWSSQGDLLFAINASQDEFSRIVLTPGDPQEAFQAGRISQALAWKYQVPVIIITDKNLSESFYTADKFKLTPKIIPPVRSINLANSYEHDSCGFSTEDSSEKTRQTQRRLHKLALIINDPLLPGPQIFGPKVAKITLISWGANKGPVREALKTLPRVNYLHFSYVWPFPQQPFISLLKFINQPVLLEANATGQLGKLIRQETGMEIKNKLLKYDGRPFFPEEIVKLCR